MHKCACTHTRTERERERKTHKTLTRIPHTTHNANWDTQTAICDFNHECWWMPIVSNEPHYFCASTAWFSNTQHTFTNCLLFFFLFQISQKERQRSRTRIFEWQDGLCSSILLHKKYSSSYWSIWCVSWIWLQSGRKTPTLSYKEDKYRRD